MEILKIGCHGTHDADFVTDRPNGYPFYLFLLIKTSAVFVIDEQKINVQSGSFILYEPDHPHYYYADSNLYINDWIRIDAPEGSEFFKELNIPVNTPVKLWDDSFISDMTRLISSEFYSVNSKKELTIQLLLHAMFTKLSELLLENSSTTNMNSHYSDLVALRREIYSNPHMQWTIPDLADQLNLCKPYFQKIYKQTFGISCMSDVIQAKIGHAKDLLAKTDMTIRAVAYECGYNNEVHFMRQFKQIVNATPSEYRIHAKKE